MGPCVMGIDGGTEGFRAGVFDVETGACVGIGVAPNRTVYPGPGFAEQSVEDWEVALVNSIRSCLEDAKKAGVGPSDIRAVGVDGTTCTLVYLDRHGRPLRPAILWMDVRAAAEAAAVTTTGHRSLLYAGGNPVSAEWFPAKAAWTRANEPAVYERTATLFEETDWITFRLTGERTVSLNTITARWFYNNRAGGWPLDLYRTIGISDVMDRVPSRVVRMGEMVGTVSTEIAEQTGLPPGVPVAGGASDAYSALVGVNVLQPGKTALVTGSSQLQMGVTRRSVHAKGLFGSFPDAVVPGLEIVEAGQVSTGSVLRWFTSQFVPGYDSAGGGPAGRPIYRELDEKAGEIAPGSEGLVVLEHWQGNRTPWTDPESRGVIRGLTLRHTPVHIYRAIMEGVGYGTRVILDTMESAGCAVSELTACGGATRSRIWMQILADICGKPIRIAAESDAATLGSAIAAATAAGLAGDLAEAAGRMVRYAGAFEPDAAATDRYAPYVAQYVATYERLREDARRLVRIAERPGK